MLEVQEWPIERLVPYARNPRVNDHAVDRMASMIREFGFRVPIIAKSDGTVIDGHLRLKAAQKLGMDSVPVALADDLTDAQVKALRIAVNRMAELASWDTELLSLELDELREMDFDIDLTLVDDSLISQPIAEIFDDQFGSDILGDSSAIRLTIDFETEDDRRDMSDYIATSGIKYTALR